MESLLHYTPYTPLHTPIQRLACGFSTINWAVPVGMLCGTPSPSTEASPSSRLCPWQHAGRLSAPKLTFPPPMYFPWTDLCSLGR